MKLNQINNCAISSCQDLMLMAESLKSKNEPLTIYINHDNYITIKPSPQQLTDPQKQINTLPKSDMPKRKLGKTGTYVSILSLGGQGSLETQGGKHNCVNIIQRAFELGITYADTSPIYGDGLSEKYYGEALDGWREKIYLASKTDKRSKDGSLKELEKSLKRMKTDYLNLWQIHHLDTMDDVDKVTSKNGALEALIEMKEQKVVRHLGVTSHAHPSLLLEIFKRYDFDVVLCPINVGDRGMNPSFIDTVVKEANKRDMGIVGMKIFAQRYAFHPKAATTAWELITYALSQPISTIIVGIDSIAQLEENVAIAKNFRPMDADMMKKLENNSKPYTRRICFFRKEYGGYDSQKELEPPYIITSDI